MNLVIVESPAKAKTINKYLGENYKVLASYGHIRDLPSKNGSVDPDRDFKMEWEVDSFSKKYLKEITDAAKDSSKIILATKIAGRTSNVPSGPPGLDWIRKGPRLNEEHIFEAIENSLKRLNTEYIDLYYLHRRDFNVPIEDSVGALADAVRAGKIGNIGLSECSSDTILKAHAEHKICAVQSEYSLWTRDPDYKVIQQCRDLGIGFVPFSPLGRAFLSGVVRDMTKLEDGDMRHSMPRFSGSNFESKLNAQSKKIDRHSGSLISSIL